MGEDDEFDVELWERILRTPVTEPLDRTRPDRVEFDTTDLDLDLDVDLDVDLPPYGGTTAEVVEGGFPSFEHNQWTVEGEIERFGAFGRGASRATGWKRIVALVLIALLVGPIVVGLVVTLLQAAF